MSFHYYTTCLCWSSSAQAVLSSGPVGTHCHIYILSKTFACFQMRSLLRRGEGSDCYWGWLERSLAHDLCLRSESSWAAQYRRHAHLYPPGPLMAAVLTSYIFRTSKTHFPKLLMLLHFPAVEFTELEAMLGSVSSSLPTVSAHVRNSWIL
jgi:hypothetical protein